MSYIIAGNNWGELLHETSLLMNQTVESHCSQDASHAICGLQMQHAAHSSRRIDQSMQGHASRAKLGPYKHEIIGGPVET